MLFSDIQELLMYTYMINSSNTSCFYWTQGKPHCFTITHLGLIWTSLLVKRLKVQKVYFTHVHFSISSGKKSHCVVSGALTVGSSGNTWPFLHILFLMLASPKMTSARKLVNYRWCGFLCNHLVDYTVTALSLTCSLKTALQGTYALLFRKY